MNRLWLLLAVPTLGGCILLPPTDPYAGYTRASRPPNHPSAGYDAAAQSPPRADRPDSAPATDAAGEPLSRTEAVALALAHNPDLAASTWEAAAIEARREQAAAERLPRLGLAGAYTHHLDEQRLLPVRQPGDPAVLSRDIVAGDLVLSLPLMTGGCLSNRVAASALLADAARHRVERTQAALVASVTSLFFDILAQEQVVESLVFARHTMEEHLRRVDALIAAQKAAAVDRLRSEVRLADVDQKLVRERARLAAQREAFAGLLGTRLDGESVTLEGPLRAPDPAELPDPSVALDQALARRADYAAARCALESRARSLDAARADHWPNLLLQGSYGGRWAVGDWTGAGEELDDTGRIGLALELPLFEGGRIAARVREQRAFLAADQEQLRSLERRIRLEVTTALLNVGAARQRVAALAKAIEQAHESLRIEQQKYELGKGAVLDVLDAQAALLESQTNYYGVLAELHAARADLRLATGEPGPETLSSRKAPGRNTR